MEELLQSNVGFASRIQFKLHFPDYSSDELYEIFKKMCKDRRYKLDTNMKPILIQHFEEAKKQDNFGNARYCRSLLDKITMQQAQRISQSTEDDINLIKKSDVEAVIKQIRKQQPAPVRRIGF